MGPGASGDDQNRAAGGFLAGGGDFRHLKGIALYSAAIPVDSLAMKSAACRRWVVVPLVALLALPGCRENLDARKDQEWLRLEAERVKLAHQVELLEFRLSKVEDREDELVGKRDALEEDVEFRALLVEKAALLKDELASLEVSLEAEREGRLRELRAAAIGRSFPQLAGIHGRTFDAVVITRVTDVGIEFRHATGTARIAAAELTPDQQGLFGLDPLIAGEAMEEERELVQAYDRWIDGRLSVAKVEQEEVASARLALETSRRESTAVAAAAVDSSPRTRLRDEPRPFGSSGRSIWYPYSYPRTRYYYTGTGYYCRPTTYTSRTYPNIRVASSNWSYTPRPRSCSSPVIRNSYNSTFFRP
jgi:hypothetical protein